MLFNYIPTKLKKFIFWKILFWKKVLVFSLNILEKFKIAFCFFLYFKKNLKKCFLLFLRIQIYLLRLTFSNSSAWSIIWFNNFFFYSNNFSYILLFFLYLHLTYFYFFCEHNFFFKFQHNLQKDFYNILTNFLVVFLY